MIKILLKIIKRIAFALIIIYSFDLILRGFNIVVPINYFTIGTVSLLGFPGLVMLALSFFFLL